MLFRHALSLLALAALTFPQESTATTGGLRAPRKLRPSAECTLMLSVALLEEPWAHAEGDDEMLECELDASETNGIGGLIYPLGLTKNQKKDVLDMIRGGSISPGKSKLMIGQAEATFDGETIKFKDNTNIPDFVTRGGPNLSTGRRLAGAGITHTTGTKEVLFVRVTSGDSPPKVHPDNAILMSSNVFGTTGGYTDNNNLKSQISACSMGELTFVPGNMPSNTQIANAPGVLEVTIDVTLDNPRATIRNAITTAVQNKLGYALPGPYEYVMYSVESCIQDCGWAAYAYVGSWNSVYQGGYYGMTGVQVHELGHNFGLAHSGGLDGATYTDHTCMMVRNEINNIFLMTNKLKAKKNLTIFCLIPSFLLSGESSILGRSWKNVLQPS
jgi:hypothetical protein